MKATVTTNPLSILLTPDEPGDGKTLTELMRVVNRRPFVAEEVQAIIRGQTMFGMEEAPYGVMIRLESKG